MLGRERFRARADHRIRLRPIWLQQAGAIPFDHPLAVQFEHPGRGEAARDRDAHSGWSGASFHCKDKNFGIALNVVGDDDLRGPVAGPPITVLGHHAYGGLAQDVEQRPSAGEGLLRQPTTLTVS